MIGVYKCYSDTHSGIDFVTESAMQKKVADKFHRYMDTLGDSLGCEDYEQEGIIDLSGLKEAILSVDDQVDDHVLDYMLYYVYVRSDSTEKLEYGVLIGLIDEVMARKARPVSSSPDKIKQRNPEPVSSGDDEYSDMEKESDLQPEDEDPS